MKQKFFRLLFILFFNALLYLTITLNLNYLYPTLNLLIIFFIFELYYQKKKFHEESVKFNKKNNFDINDLPASEHPIIKAARKRLNH